MLSNAVAPDQVGGLYRYVRELSAALVRTGARVTVITKRSTVDLPERETGADGVELIRYSVGSKRSPLFGPLYPVRAARPVVGAMRRRTGDQVFHGHFPLPALPATFGSHPYLYTFHSPVYRELLPERQGTYALPGPMQKPAVALLKAVERRALARAARILVLSEYSRREIALLDEGAAQRVRVLPGGLDIERFTPGSPVDDDWTCVRGGPLLLTARRLIPRTGVYELVEAMELIRQRVPDARLAIAGCGAQEERIRTLAAQLGLSHEVVRFLGDLRDDQLVGWYRGADLVVMPTQELEGFGLMTVEALACGTPVVGTPSGATPEILGPLDPRLVAASPKPQDIAAAVIAVLEDRDGLAVLRARARDRVAPAMGWDAIAAAHLEEYARLVHGAR
jgi:glycosyltransferase involved in cell wall biosynthesis